MHGCPTANASPVSPVSLITIALRNGPTRTPPRFAPPSGDIPQAQ
jgi:hypothetical protein